MREAPQWVIEAYVEHGGVLDMDVYGAEYFRREQIKNLKQKTINSRVAKGFGVRGLSKEQVRCLPATIIGIKRTESVHELASLYSLSDVFVNPTYVDNFPTTNIEALACGTPVVTYHTGGSPEAIDYSTGIVVSKGDRERLKQAIIKVVSNPNLYPREACRKRAVEHYDKEQRFGDYIDLFNRALGKD